MIIHVVTPYVNLPDPGTGVVLWPIRLDLMPFFTALEGTMAYRKLVPWRSMALAPRQYVFGAVKSDVCTFSAEDGKLRWI